VSVLKKYHKRLDKVEKGVEQEAYRIIQQEQKRIIALNTEEQLHLGLGQKGQKLLPRYSRVRYALRKNQLNPLAGLGTPDLKLTGEFYDKFFLTTKSKQVEFNSSAEHTKHLVKRYGSTQDIFGLNTKNAAILNNEILFPKLAKWLLKTLKL
tara:strand:- start:37661 stop:38116 length:456 start_codon:yes stop_codon:yes gene_type:complete